MATAAAAATAAGLEFIIMLEKNLGKFLPDIIITIAD
jgi:hypothetical protein